MKILTIHGIEKEFIIDNGLIYCINIENRNFYLSILDSFMNADSTKIFYAENNELLDLNKKMLIITDLYNISPNNKKILNNLYKRISEKMINQKINDFIQNTNQQMISILEEISLNLNLSIDYELDLDITKILNLYKFCFKENSSTIIDRIITYVKANVEIMNLSFVVSFNIIQLLNSEEIYLLQKELELLNLSLINFNFVGKNINKIVNYTTIDDDLCEY